MSQEPQEARPTEKPSFRELLINHMAEKRLTTRELATATGLHRWTIIGWRRTNGYLPDNIGVVNKVADGLELSDQERAYFVEIWRDEHTARHPKEVPVSGTFSGFLKLHRTVTEEEQARLLGVNLRTYLYWEHGRHIPDDDTVREVARIMGGEEEEASRLAEVDRQKPRAERIAWRRTVQKEGVRIRS